MDLLQISILPGLGEDSQGFISHLSSIWLVEVEGTEKWIKECLPAHRQLFQIYIRELSSFITNYVIYVNYVKYHSCLRFDRSLHQGRFISSIAPRRFDCKVLTWLFCFGEGCEWDGCCCLRCSYWDDFGLRDVPSWIQRIIKDSTVSIIQFLSL